MKIPSTGRKTQYNSACLFGPEGRKSAHGRPGCSTNAAIKSANSRRRSLKENSPICAGGKPLTGSYITALHRAWHEDCFRCPPAVSNRWAKNASSNTATGPITKPAITTVSARVAPIVAGPSSGRSRPPRARPGTPNISCARAVGNRSMGAPFMSMKARSTAKITIGRHSASAVRLVAKFSGAYQINAWGDTYCAEHADGLAECYSCHRFICERLTRWWRAS